MPDWAEMGNWADLTASPGENGAPSSSWASRSDALPAIGLSFCCHRIFDQAIPPAVFGGIESKVRAADHVFYTLCQSRWSAPARAFCETLPDT